MLKNCPQPRRINPPVCPLPRSLATTSGISVDFSSSPYLDVSVQAVPHMYLCIQYMLTEYCSAGFPHSEISGSKAVCASPKLIAACHVLHRLLMPRHSPCALISLTFVGTSFVSLASTSRSKLVHAAVPPPPRKPTSLGFARIYGSHELCRLHRSFANWLIVLPIH